MSCETQRRIVVCGIEGRRLIRERRPAGDSGTEVGRRSVILAGAALALPRRLAAQRRRPSAGVWLRIGDASEIERTLQMIRDRNTAFTRRGRAPAWQGVIFEQTWGQIETAVDQWQTNSLQRVLDAMASAGLLGVIQVSDKEWQYQSHDDRYAPPVPADLDADPIGRDAFADCPDNLCQDRHRYATLQDDTVRGRPGSAVRKYVAKRWVLQDRWAAMWAAIGHAVGRHPALFGVLSPESALALPGRRYLSLVGYPGSDWYVSYLVRQAELMRAAFPADVQVISNINVVPPDNARTLPIVVNRLATLGLSIWSQDLNPGGQAYRVLYPLLDRFPSHRRWAMVTNTTNLGPLAMVQFAHKLGVGHLAFLHAGFMEQVRAIESPSNSGASFLPPR